MDEQEAITRALQHYIDGAKSGRSSEMRLAFHESATILGYEGKSLFGGPIQKLYDWHEKNGPARELEAQIVSIDIAGSAATARLELNNWTGTRYTDFFTLLKVDDTWKIMSKVFNVPS